MLYDPSRHQKIIPKNFNEFEIRRAIQRILDDTLSASLTRDSLWSIHPKDRYAGCPEVLTDFYMGAAGVVWALYELKAYSSSNLVEYCKVKIDQVLAEHLKLSEASHYTDKGAYFVGEAGVRAVKEKIHPSSENQLALLALIESKLDSIQNEILYGLPGVLLLANFNHKLENKKQIATLVEHLLSTREIDPNSQAKIWSQNFEKSFQFLGAAHGSVGNYGVLLRVLDPCEKEIRLDIIANLEKILVTYAKFENNLCNWPRTLDLKPDANFLVHWCHGATGVVTELATNVKKEESEIISDLILKAGALIWEAGALEKGTSLCHGTAGSGMAMLKLYERTQDSVWLDRAQAIAMHALEQQNLEIQSAGQLRFSLWTGDLGLAIFLRDVLKATSSSMPGIDIF